MTNLEAIEELKEEMEVFKAGIDAKALKNPDAELKKVLEANDLAIKALEQQPSEDCISREALLEELGEEPFNWNDSPEEYQEVSDYQWFKSLVENAPSVTPQQKVGEWVLKHRKYNSMKYLTGTDEYGVEHTVKKYEEYECDEPYCSECGKLAGDTSQNYCPYCGAKMEVRKDDTYTSPKHNS